MGLFGDDIEGVPLPELGTNVWERFAARTRNSVMPDGGRAAGGISRILDRTVPKVFKDFKTVLEGGPPPPPGWTPPDVMLPDTAAEVVDDAANAAARRMRRAVKPHEGRKEGGVSEWIDGYLPEQAHAAVLPYDLARGTASVHDSDFAQRLVDLVGLLPFLAGPAAKLGSAAVRSAGWRSFRGRAFRAAQMDAAERMQAAIRSKDAARAGSETVQPARSAVNPVEPIAGENYAEPLLGESANPDLLFDRSIIGPSHRVPQLDLPRYQPPRLPARIQEITSDRSVRDQVGATIDAGIQMGALNWHNAEPLRIEFIRALGKDNGNAAFNRYIDFIAATTPRSDVGTNIRNASYYYQRLMKGESMPIPGTANPSPYGHVAQRIHQINAQRVADSGLDPLVNRKGVSLAENFRGNYAPVAVDTHAFRLPAILARDPRFLRTSVWDAKGARPENIRAMVERGELTMDDAVVRPVYWQAVPKRDEYAGMERFYKELAGEAGVAPAQGQTSAWIGGAEHTGLVTDPTKSFLDLMEDRIRRTAQQSGIEPREVLSRFIRGKMPLLSLGAGVAVGTHEDQDRDSP